MEYYKLHNEVARLTGKKIRQVRGKIKQKDFSQMVGIHKDQLSRYERGKSIPREESLKKIAEYGNVPIDYFRITDQVPIYEVQTTEQKKLLNSVKEILESKNQTAIDALAANIKAFLEMVRISKKHDENKEKGGGGEENEKN